MLSRVSPFRNLRITEYLLLPAAYRSLSRLSSALSAKASTLRPYQLDLIKNFVLVRCIALHLFFFACQLILQNYLAWMSDKSYLYDLFFYMQFSRYHQIKSYKILSFTSCFATCALHHAVKIKLKSMLRNLWFTLRCEDHLNQVQLRFQRCEIKLESVLRNCAVPTCEDQLMPF